MWFVDLTASGEGWRGGMESAACRDDVVQVNLDHVSMIVPVKLPSVGSWIHFTGTPYPLSVVETPEEIARKSQAALLPGLDLEAHLATAVQAPEAATG